MENASKAMIIVASFVIAVMVLSIMVYLFVNAGRVPAQFEYTKQAEDVSAFNAKFEKYALISDTETPRGELSGEELNNVSNSFSDVISLCNLAYNINCKNDNDAHASVIVDFEIGGDSYCVYPMEDDRERPVLEKDSVFMCKSSNLGAMTKNNTKNLYQIMEESYNGFKLNEAKYDDLNRLRYKYYFDCELDYGYDETKGTFQNEGRITKITFTLVENAEYDP